VRYTFSMRQLPCRRSVPAAAAGLVAILAGCGPSVSVTHLVPAPYNLGPATSIVLVEVDGDPAVRSNLARRFVSTVQSDGVFRIGDATGARTRLSELGEGEAARSAKGFRNAWPADVYAKVDLADLTSRQRSERRMEKGKDGQEHERRRFWAEASCGVDVRLVDGRTGRLLASYRSEEIRTGYKRDVWDPSQLRLAEADALDAAVRTAVDQFTPRRERDAIFLEGDAPEAAAGLARIDAGDLSGARRLWETALSRFPQDPRLHFNLGAVSESLGDRKAAREYYDDAIRLAPGEERYRRALQTLEQRERDAEALRTRG